MRTKPSHFEHENSRRLATSGTRRERPLREEKLAAAGRSVDLVVVKGAYEKYAGRLEGIFQCGWDGSHLRATKRLAQEARSRTAETKQRAKPRAARAQTMRNRVSIESRFKRPCLFFQRIPSHRLARVLEPVFMEKNL